MTTMARIIIVSVRSPNRPEIIAAIILISTGRYISRQKPD